VPLLRQPQGLLQQAFQNLALRAVRKELSLPKLRGERPAFLVAAAIWEKMSNDGELKIWL
jgi:hypothetical protein